MKFFLRVLKIALFGLRKICVSSIKILSKEILIIIREVKKIPNKAKERMKRDCRFYGKTYSQLFQCHQEESWVSDGQGVVSTHDLSS